MSATYGLDFDRQVSASTFDVRRVISVAMRELGFEITVDQLTRVEAKRGGMLGMSVMMKRKMPVLAVFEVSAVQSGCAVVAHLTDNIKNLGKTFGMNHQFREIFDEVQSRVDLGLAELDRAAAGSFAEPRFWSRAGEIGVLEKTNVLTTKAVGSAVGAAGKALDGPRGSTMPKVWKGVDSVTFTSSAGVAVLTLAETQARLGIAVMIVSNPGSMPPNLARDVETLAAGVETTLTAAGGKAAQVDVSDAQRPVLEFLDQQAEIRSGLPLRQLHTCRSCRLEKITNPEYERITARNEKLGDIMAGVGATIGKGGISPTFVLGQVFKLKKLDPSYVCSRCQGLEADERVVTFCPNCGDLARDVVLRICPKCKFDYRTRASKTPVWAQPQAPEPEPEPEAASEPQPGAASEPEPGSGTASEVARSTEADVAQPAAQPARPEAPRWVAQSVPPIAAPPAAQIAAPPVQSPAAQPAPTTPAAQPAHPEAPRWDAKSVPPIAAPAVQPPAVQPDQPAAPQWAVAAPPARSAWPTPGEVPLGQAPLGRRGKRCQMCHRDYPTLWRVVIGTPAGFEERFICGTTVTCQMVSLVPAVPA